MAGVLRRSSRINDVTTRLVLFVLVALDASLGNHGRPYLAVVVVVVAARYAAHRCALQLPLVPYEINTSIAIWSFAFLSPICTYTNAKIYTDKRSIISIWWYTRTHTRSFNIRLKITHILVTYNIIT